MTNLTISQQKQNQSAIEAAKEVLARCEDETVISFTIILQHPDNSFTTISTASEGRRRTAGGLLDAAIHVLCS